jgi:hypothetical protein
MSLLDGLGSLFGTSAGSQAAKPEEPCQGETGRIDHLCRQLGWRVDEREGKSIRLYFNDPLAKCRKVYIDMGKNQRVWFMVYSFARLPMQRIPVQVLGHLLRQNSDLGLGAWQVQVDDHHETAFALQYAALGEGLTAAVFKHVCESMIREAITFDGKMLSAGLLKPGYGQF